MAVNLPEADFGGAAAQRESAVDRVKPPSLQMAVSAQSGRSLSWTSP